MMNKQNINIYNYYSEKKKHTHYVTNIRNVNNIEAGTLQ